MDTVTLNDLLECFAFDFSEDAVKDEYMELVNALVEGEIVSMEAEMSTNCPDVTHLPPMILFLFVLQICRPIYTLHHKQRAVLIIILESIFFGNRDIRNFLWRLQCFLANPILFGDSKIFLSTSIFFWRLQIFLGD